MDTHSRRPVLAWSPLVYGRPCAVSSWRIGGPHIPRGSSGATLDLVHRRRSGSNGTALLCVKPHEDADDQSRLTKKYRVHTASVTRAMEPPAGPSPRRRRALGRTKPSTGVSGPTIVRRRARCRAPDERTATAYRHRSLSNHLQVSSGSSLFSMNGDPHASRESPPGFPT